VRKREQKVRDREERRNLKRVKRRQDEEQRKLQLKRKNRVDPLQTEGPPAEGPSPPPPPG
jgi:hypothetical protein